jgi:hypothetical protein
LVTGCALGGAFGVVLPVVLFCTAFFAVVGVAFGVEFAEDTWEGFASVGPEDFVMCYLLRWKSVSVIAKRWYQMRGCWMSVFDREEKTYPHYSELHTRSYPMFARENGHNPDPEREVSNAFHDGVTHVTDEYCKRRDG